MSTISLYNRIFYCYFYQNALKYYLNLLLIINSKFLIRSTTKHKSQIPALINKTLTQQNPYNPNNIKCSLKHILLYCTICRS
jgi:hypothetical protein